MAHTGNGANASYIATFVHLAAVIKGPMLVAGCGLVSYCRQLKQGRLTTRTYIFSLNRTFDVFFIAIPIHHEAAPRLNPDVVLKGRHECLLQ